MSLFRLATALLASGLLASCTTPPGSSGTGDAPSVTLELRPQFVEGGYASQATVLPNTKASVDHLMLTLSRKLPVEDTTVSRTIAKAQLDETVRFTGLKANSTYWLEAKAYKAADETLAANLISEPATAAIAVGVDDTIIVLEGQAFRIRLKDVSFSGTGTASFDFTDGGYVTPDPEAISLVTP